MNKKKQEVITFKMDRDQLEAMKGIPNRSAFIRAAIMAALDNMCPLCRGTGILTPAQKAHWDALSENHSIAECGDCHQMVLVCRAASTPKHKEVHHETD